MRQKPTFVTNRMPYDAENKTLSKVDFVAKMRAKKELEAKLKAYENELKGGSDDKQKPVEEPKENTVKSEDAQPVEQHKKAGRPKKIE